MRAFQALFCGIFFAVAPWFFRQSVSIGIGCGRFQVILFSLLRSKFEMRGSFSVRIIFFKSLRHAALVPIFVFHEAASSIQPLHILLTKQLTFHGTVPSIPFVLDLSCRDTNQVFVVAGSGGITDASQGSRERWLAGHTSRHVALPPSVMIVSPGIQLGRHECTARFHHVTIACCHHVTIM